MRRDSIIAFIKDVPAAAFDGMIANLGMGGELCHGGILDAIDAAPRWTLLPSFVVLDVTGIDDPLGAIGAFAKAAPEGEMDLIVVGVKDSVDLMRSLLRSNVADYLLKPLNLQVMAEILARIITDRRQRGRQIDPKRIVAFVGARGGVGTSLIAATAAVAMAKLHKVGTLLVDLDLSWGVQHLLFNQEKSPPLVSMLEDSKRVDSIMLERTMRRVEGVSRNLRLLSHATNEEHAPIPAENVAELLHQAQFGLEATVLDMPFRGAVALQTLLGCGHVYIVATPTMAALRDALYIGNFVEGKNRQGKVTYVVNKVGEGRAGVDAVPPPEFIRKSREARLIELPYDPKSAALALLEERTLFDLRGPLPKALPRLVDSLPSAPPHDGKRASPLARFLGSARKDRP